MPDTNRRPYLNSLTITWIQHAMSLRTALARLTPAIALPDLAVPANLEHMPAALDQARDLLLLGLLPADLADALREAVVWTSAAQQMIGLLLDHPAPGETEIEAARLMIRSANRRLKDALALM